MQYAKPLPNFLIDRFNAWKTKDYQENKALFDELSKGQSPHSMVISCCDSRVHVTSIFGADQGEFFIHRNIANLVPPFGPDGTYHGTSAAVEFAVTALKVKHLIVMGHSACGGVAGCYEMCSGRAPQLEEKTSFVGRWIEILRPGFDRLPAGDDDSRRDALEKEAVIVSLENLMTFPFVKERVESGALTLHGLWHDIGRGDVEVFDPDSSTFGRIGA